MLQWSFTVTLLNMIDCGILVGLLLLVIVSVADTDEALLKPNSITLASSELAPNMFGASSELVRGWFEAEIWLAAN